MEAGNKLFCVNFVADDGSFSLLLFSFLAEVTGTGAGAGAEATGATGTTGATWATGAGGRDAL